MIERPLYWNGLVLHYTAARDWGFNYGKPADPGEPADPEASGRLRNSPADDRPNTIFRGDIIAQQEWWIEVHHIDGLWGADVVDERFQMPGRHGERSGDDFYSGKDITINGVVHGKTLSGLRRGQRALVAAFADLSLHALYMRSWIDANRLYLNCRVNQKLDMPEEQVSQTWDRPFTVQLRADDPRVYSVIEKTDTSLLGQASGGTSGQRLRLYELPAVAGVHRRDYPLPGLRRNYSTMPIGGPTGRITNAGAKDTYPVTELYGPMHDPVYHNLTTGKVLQWRGLTLTAGQFIRVDHDAGLILFNGIGGPYLGGLDVINSEFWPLAAGENILSLIPASAGAGAKAILYWRDAVM